MKKMTKRTLALAMSTGMLLSNSVWAADTDADPYGAMPETVTLHVGRSEDANASYLSGQDSLNNYLVDYIKEQLNVDFVYDFSVASDYSHMGKPRRPCLAILVHLAVAAVRRDLDVQSLAHIPGVAGKGRGKQRSR